MLDARDRAGPLVGVALHPPRRAGDVAVAQADRDSGELAFGYVDCVSMGRLQQRRERFEPR